MINDVKRRKVTIWIMKLGAGVVSLAAALTSPEKISLAREYIVRETNPSLIPGQKKDKSHIALCLH